MRTCRRIPAERAFDLGANGRLELPLCEDGNQALVCAVPGNGGRGSKERNRSTLPQHLSIGSSLVEPASVRLI